MQFMAQRMSSPIAFQASGGTALASAAASLLAAIQQFRKSSDLSATWTGASAQAHEQRAAKLIDAATRVAQAIARAQTVTASGATRMQTLKTQNDATVASAIAGRFVVLPSGQVVPGPEHYASAVGPHAAAIMKMYWTIAKLYTGQVNANVATSTATDGQVAATLAAIAIEFFADLLKKKGGANPAALQPPTGLPGSTPLDPFTIPPEPPAIPDPGPTGPGTSLAGAGALGGAGSFPGGLGGGYGGPGMAGGGLGGIGGPGGLGPGGGGLPGGAAGAGGPGMMGGVPIGGGAAGAGVAGRGGGAAGGAMLGRGGASGGVAAGGAGVAGAGGARGGAAGGAAGGRGGAAGARGGAGGAGGAMGPMGYGSGQHEEHADSDTWLREDGNPWDPDEAPGSVLS
ncbi:hypothetical protein Rhe02_77790 [Rhizocola hellebori]|uniref:Uncharacterized protein n=1 Tax=Rhizocola hellebori TaxID=1392758 RepID=A0A8J3QHH3_9ACTN|nr:hypothetical protein [Rhizocola hellebori]GIH09712.1 hypothetical protein Rhe02_77790 [Rhizocola hellebori]